MATKRATHEEGYDGRKDHQVPGKRRLTYSGHGDQASTAATSSSSNTINDMALLESIVRKVVQEAIPPIIEQVMPSILHRYLNPQTGTSGGRALQLCFLNAPPPIIYSLSDITAERAGPLQIALLHDHDRRIVEEVSSKVKTQICVLDGDFGSNGIDDWTQEEFNSNTLSPREGKGPLLCGDTVITVTLNNGIGYINQGISLSDNSSWTRSGKFRLGLKVLQYSNSFGGNIREGRSGPFRVKDNRGKATEKHECPSMNDKVWRLKKIAKDGTIHNQLGLHGIETVKDLLQLYTTDQASLLQKIGNIASKSWNTIIEHAKACDINDDEKYSYHYVTAEQSIFLVLNCIYEVVEVSFKGQNFRPLQSLNSEQERLVEKAKQLAYKNLKDLVPLERTPHGLVKALEGEQAGQYGQPETWPNFCEPSTSRSHHQYDQIAGSNQLAAYIDEYECPFSGPFINEYMNCLSYPLPLEQFNPFNLPSNYYGAESSNHFSYPTSAVCVSSEGKGKRVWDKIRNVLKWFLPLHEAKRKANVFHSPSLNFSPN